MRPTIQKRECIDYQIRFSKKKRAGYELHRIPIKDARNLFDYLSLNVKSFSDLQGLPYFNFLTFFNFANKSIIVDLSGTEVHPIYIHLEPLNENLVGKPTFETLNQHEKY